MRISLSELMARIERLVRRGATDVSVEWQGEVVRLGWRSPGCLSRSITLELVR